MIDALVYGLLANSGLLVGAAIGLVTTPSRRVIASVMAFGAGVLVSALTFDLMTEAFEGEGSPVAVVLAFLLGALIYVGHRPHPRSPRCSIAQARGPASSGR